MNLRTIYLQNYLSINGRSALIGRALYDRFKELSDETLLAHMIYNDVAYEEVTNADLKRDILSHSLVRDFRPNVIYMEGGLFANHKGQWKIPREIAEEVCGDGGVVIVADVEHNQLYPKKRYYSAAGDFFKAHARYVENDSDHPVYASDESSFWKGHRQILCKPEAMIVSEWIKPIYEGIPAVLAGLPVHLESFDSTLVSCNRDTTGMLHSDTWVEMNSPCPFGSVAQLQSGFAVLIAGAVSSDAWLEGCRHNTAWLTQIAEFLVDQASRNLSRGSSHWRSPHRLFLSHRSTDKEIVRKVATAIKARGVGIWLDEETLIPSQSLVGEIDRALRSMTHFVIFWSASCVGAPWVERELRSATSRLIEKGVPMLIVSLDETPVPTIVADILRIEAAKCKPDEIADRITGAVERLARRKEKGA